MKKTILSIIIAVAAGFISEVSAQKTEFANEDLNYEILYKWGFEKHMASATLRLRNDGSQYKTSLIARTRSWVDKIYKVRDTLTCTIDKNGFRPLKYVKISHEGDHDGKDVVKYSYSGNSTIANCTLERNKKPTRNLSHETTGQAYDMLSVFYYLRMIDFDEFKKNGSLTTTVFSGKRKERVDVRYHGEKVVKLRDGSKHNSYHITFKFSEEGKQKSSDDINCWISADSRHIPLKLEGSVKIGKVRVFYAPKKQ